MAQTQEKQDRKKQFLAAVQAVFSTPPLNSKQPVNNKQPGTDHIIEHLLEHCHHQHYAAKSIIIQQGEMADELFYIVKGSVTVSLQVHKGSELVLAYLNAGNFFGEIGLFNQYGRRSAVVRTRTACEIAQINYEKLRSLSSIYPELLPAIACQMAIRIRKTNRKVGDIAFTDVPGRTVRTLLDLCKEPDAMTHPQGIQIQITRQELGRIVGCSREMVGRTLKSLQEQHLIFVKGKSIVIFGNRS
jgi:CRP/FNR family transcriptional regulator, cyclic AMP receptor protein